MPLPRGIGFGIAEGLNNFANSYRQTQNDQFMRQVYQQQAQKNALETQKLKQETDDVDLAVVSVGVAKNLADLGFLPEDKVHSFALKKIDAAIQSPAAAAYANQRISALFQGSNYGRGGQQQSLESGQSAPQPPSQPTQGQMGTPDQSEAAFQPFHVRLSPKQYDTYSKYMLKEPGFAIQLQKIQDAKDKAVADRASREAIADKNNETKLKAAGINAYGPRAQSYGDRVIQAGNNAYDSSKVMNGYESRLDASKRIQAILDGINSGELIPTRNLGSQLATDINLLQANKVTITGTGHVMPQETFYSQVGDVAHWMTGDPNERGVMPGDLKQMGIENKALYNEIGNEHAKKFSSWILGQPQSTVPRLTARFNQSRENYGFTPTQSPKIGTAPSNVSSTTKEKPPLPPGVPPNAQYSPSTHSYWVNGKRVK